MDSKDFSDFEARKADHLRLAMDTRTQARAGSGWDEIHLVHEALPELNLDGIELSSKFWDHSATSPLFISSMTAGHHQGEALNTVLAKGAAIRGWPMGVGSQRRELDDPTAAEEWRRLRKAAPQACFFSNLGITQLIQYGHEAALRLTHSLEAQAIIIHLNALQEALQPEGTPLFAGGLTAIEGLSRAANLPIVVKETGCGFSKATLQRLFSAGVSAVDIGGYGGTHWGRIEGFRAAPDSLQALAAQTFAHWGEPTPYCLQEAKDVGRKNQELWASGGVRSGLDAAKAIALGADKVGLAQPALAAALQGENALQRWMEQMEFELKLALFCTGSRTVEQLREGSRWRKI